MRSGKKSSSKSSKSSQKKHSKKMLKLRSMRSMLTCTMKSDHITEIEKGSKKYDARPATPFFQEFTKGKRVKWFSKQNSVLTEIEEVHKFRTIDEMFKQFNFKEVFPHVKTIEEAKQIYKNNPENESKIKKFGMVLLKLKVVK